MSMIDRCHTCAELVTRCSCKESHAEKAARYTEYRRKEAARV